MTSQKKDIRKLRSSSNQIKHKFSISRRTFNLSNDESEIMTGDDEKLNNHLYRRDHSSWRRIKSPFIGHFAFLRRSREIADRQLNVTRQSRSRDSRQKCLPFGARPFANTKLPCIISWLSSRGSIQSSAHWFAFLRPPVVAPRTKNPSRASRKWLLEKRKSINLHQKAVQRQISPVLSERIACEVCD